MKSAVQISAPLGAEERVLVLPYVHRDGHGEVEAQMHFQMGKCGLNIFLKI